MIESAITEELSKHFSVLNGIDLPVAIRSKNGTYPFFNDAFTRTFNLKNENPSDEVLFGKKYTSLQQKLNNLSDSESKDHLTEIIELGTQIYQLTAWNSPGKSSQAPWIFLLIIPDLSHELLEELHDERQNLIKVEQLSQIGYWDHNLSTDKLFWSDGLFQIYGLNPASFDLNFESFLQHVHPDDRELVKEKYSESLQNRTRFHLVHRVISGDDKEKYVEAKCEHELDASGNPVRSIGTVTDITERVQTQKDLLIANIVYENISSAIMVTDSHQNIIHVNRSFEELSGYERKDILGKNPRVLQSGWQAPDFYEKMWAEIKGNGYWTGEVWDRRVDGSLYASRLNITAIKDEYGRISNYIGVTTDITQEKEQENRIKELAHFDFLTGLPNRILFFERVAQRIGAAASYNRPFVILYIDLDNFKVLNDSLGHQAGDEYLKVVSLRLRDSLNDADSVARVGGDEFLILIESLSLPQDAGFIAEKLMAAVTEPVVVGDNSLYAHCSIGISVYPQDGNTAEKLIQNADSAMNYAKSLGKNNYQFFTEEMHVQASDKLNYTLYLRDALANDEFSLVYQPKVNSLTNQVEGMEALLRWHSPQLGFVPPDKFIGFAEETGLIVEIGRWVLRKAALDTIPLLDRYPHLVLSVNASANELLHRNYIEQLEKIVRETKIPEKNLEIEITESLIMENMNIIVPKLEALREMGISVSIDDFGTGYSSMSKLKTLPVKTLKIDRAFIKDIDTSKEDRAITKAIIKMAESLGLSCIAEGAETKDHITILQDLHCTMIQGYFCSKPLPMPEFEKFLSEFPAE